MTRFLIGVIAMFAALNVLGESITVDATGHYARINEPEFVELEGGHELYPGCEVRIAIQAAIGSW